MLHRIVAAAAQGKARSHLQVSPPLPPRAPSPAKPAIALDAIGNAPASYAPIMQPATPSNDACMSDDDAWGSDFDDDIYTEEELAAFNAKFDQDTQDIERFNIENNVPNFNQSRIPPPPPARRCVGSAIGVSNAPGGGQRT